MPLVSILMPAFNSAATIEATLASALAQTYPNIEVIVVDDGSTDTTATIVEDFRLRDPRIRCIRQENRGIAAARNRALREARGMLVALLDSDDLWHSEKLARQVALMREHDFRLSFVYCVYRQIDGRDTITTAPGNFVAVSGWALCRLIVVNFVGGGSNIIARTDLVRRAGGFDERWREWGLEGADDYALQIELASMAPVGVCAAALVGYRNLPASHSKNRRRRYLARKKVFELYRRRYPELPNWLFRVAGANAHLIEFRASVDHQRVFAAETVARSLIEHPFAATQAWSVYLQRRLDDKLRRAARAMVGVNFYDADPDAAIVEMRDVFIRPADWRKLENLDQSRTPLLAARQGAVLGAVGEESGELTGVANG